MSVIQNQLEKLATSFLLASEANDTEQMNAIRLQTETLTKYNALLHNTAPVTKVSKTKAVEVKKAGRTSYSEDEIQKSPVEIALIMPYAKFDKVNPQPKQPVEFLQVGMVKNRRNGSSDMLIALKSCETVQDLEAGKIYAFKSLRDVTYLSE